MKYLLLLFTIFIIVFAMADSNFCKFWNVFNISVLSLFAIVVVALCLHLNVQIHLRLFSTFILATANAQSGLRSNGIDGQRTGLIERGGGERGGGCVEERISGG